MISEVIPAQRVLLPNWTLPTRAVGQEFQFVATDDCVRLRFRVPDTTFVTIPEPLPFVRYHYRVVLTERAWSSLVDESDTTFTWTIIGETSAGVATRVTTTNELKVDGGVTIDLSIADAKLVGEEIDDEAGVSVARAGDVDGDGHDDLLLGANDNSEGGSEAGAAYLVLGPVTGTLDLSMADAKLVGEEADDQAGYSVSGAGDVDGDGHDDLLVGAWVNDEGGSAAGAAYLVLGPVTGTLDLSVADAKLIGEEAADDAGFSVSRAGDVDGDGRADMLVGARANDEGGSDAGAAYLVLGPATGTLDLSLADAKLVGEAAGDWAGERVSGAGDVDGDGHDDLLVGAWRNDEGGLSDGAAYLVLGPATGTLDLSLADAKLVGESRTSSDNCSNVAGAGDVDGDGHDDLLVGAPGNDEGGRNAGAAYLVLGSVRGTLDLSLADAKLLGERNNDQAGWSVSGAGDVDADGHDDLLVGAYANSEGGALAGAAYVVLGPTTGTLDLYRADAKLVGEESYDYAGVSVSGVGDVDADGHDDLLVGAPVNNNYGGPSAGAAYLVYGGGLF